MQNKPLIIGITGPFGSGKSTAAQFFVSQGFVPIVLSSFLEEEVKKKYMGTITRKLLQDKGNELRKKYGKEILAKKALEVIKRDNIIKATVDGIRNMGEIQELQKKSNFILIALVVNRTIRFERLQKLKRREVLTWDLFKKLDYRDLGLGQKENGLRVSSCIALADVFIENNTTEEDFKRKIKNFLKKI